jgi:hypothetical protein
MDKVKAAYGYAVAWVASHPAATINVILVAVAIKIVVSVL